MQLTWKDIPVIPEANEFLDIVLNRTQRKTPTVIRPGFKISRIRQFYMRKVRYTADGFSEKLDEVVKGFPNINELHPFHRELLSTLYDKDHFKISLATLSRAKTLIEAVSRDYVRLLKFGQSLYQCKQLKIAGLGRMAKILKNCKDSLVYLEQVRQHMGRLPAIDPNTRTLIVAGYPNVGKSSFLKNISRAEVEVQPYAFTTKSLFVGHFDYKYLRFQAVDTPGILDREIESMTNIEHQSILALVNINACVLYFMDISEQCGFSLEDQVKLFNTVKVLFAKKQVIVVLNKSDVLRPEHLSQERQQMLKELEQSTSPRVELMETSCATEEGIMTVRNRACERLLAARIEAKMQRTTRINDIMNKINVARPERRDDVERTPYIPDGVETRAKYDPEDPNRRTLSKDVEQEHGGAGVYQPDYAQEYMLENDEWKHDVIPEVLDGKNVYDFIDPDIATKLQDLEQEEERLEQEGFYESEGDMMDSEDEEMHVKAEWIRNKQKEMLHATHSKRTIKKKPVIPRKMKKRSVSQMSQHFEDIGLDGQAVADKARLVGGPAAAANGNASASASASGADTVMGLNKQEKRDASKMRGKTQTDRRIDGIGANTVKKSKADKMAKAAQRARNQQARAGEADRHSTASLPKHLYTGKRGIGKTERR